MNKLIFASLILLTSCSNFQWNEVVIQGVKKDLTKIPKVKPKPRDKRLNFVGRFKFAGANIEKGSGDLVKIKSCPKDSLFVELNEFGGLSLTFRESGQYFYESIFFINSKPPLNWMVEEDLKAVMNGNRIDQSRKRVRFEGKSKLYVDYSTSIERIDDILFYSSKTTIYRPHKFFSDEFVADSQGQLHCAYGFDSLTIGQKKAQSRDMGYSAKKK